MGKKGSGTTYRGVQPLFFEAWFKKTLRNFFWQDIDEIVQPEILERYTKPEGWVVQLLLYASDCSTNTLLATRQPPHCCTDEWFLHS